MALLANLTRQPALSVPIGFTVSGLPVGMQIIARRFRDRLCLRAGAEWEQASSSPPGGRGDGFPRSSSPVSPAVIADAKRVDRDHA